MASWGLKFHSYIYLTLEKPGCQGSLMECAKSWQSNDCDAHLLRLPDPKHPPLGFFCTANSNFTHIREDFSHHYSPSAFICVAAVQTPCFLCCSFVFFCGNNSLPVFLFRVFRLFRGLNLVFVFDCGSAAPGSFAAILPEQRPNRRPDIPFEYWSLEFDVSRHRTDGPVYAQF